MSDTAVSHYTRTPSCPSCKSNERIERLEGEQAPRGEHFMWCVGCNLTFTGSRHEWETYRARERDLAARAEAPARATLAELLGRTA